MLAVTDADEAARWYERALGVRQLWNLGGVVGLEVEGAPFFLGQPEGNGWETPTVLGNRTARTEVFVNDPDAFIARAVTAGADGSVDVIRETTKRRGAHTGRSASSTRTATRGLVGDRSPLGSHP